MSKSLTPKRIVLTGSLAAMLWALQAISPLWANTSAARPAEADKLHVVLLVAGNDGNIGNADMKDIASMQQAINFAFAKDQSRVVYHDLTGKHPQSGQFYTGPEILAYLNGMNVGNNDNVLVYHSGHGCITDRNRPEDSQILCTDGGQVSRKDIRTILQAKQPRALMILSDCCSAFLGGPSAHSASRGYELAPRVNVNTVRNLLVKAAGYISITAAEDGTNAIASYQGENPGQAGSAFTVALMRAWYKHDVTFTSWEHLFPTLRTETHLASGGTHQARAFQIREHTVTTTTQPAVVPNAFDEARRVRN